LAKVVKIRVSGILSIDVVILWSSEVVFSLMHLITRS